MSAAYFADPEATGIPCSSDSTPAASEPRRTEGATSIVFAAMNRRFIRAHTLVKRTELPRSTVQDALRSLYADGRIERQPADLHSYAYRRSA